MMYNYNVYAAMHQLGVTRLRTEQITVSWARRCV